MFLSDGPYEKGQDGKHAMRFKTEHFQRLVLCDILIHATLSVPSQSV